jgi:hypothetical protein
MALQHGPGDLRPRAYEDRNFPSSGTLCSSLPTVSSPHLHCLLPVTPAQPGGQPGFLLPPISLLSLQPIPPPNYLCPHASLPPAWTGLSHISLFYSSPVPQLRPRLPSRASTPPKRALLRHKLQGGQGQDYIFSPSVMHRGQSTEGGSVTATLRVTRGVSKEIFILSSLTRGAESLSQEIRAQVDQ